MTSMPKRTDIDGLILMGGKSRRMGSNKALLCYHDNKPQWQSTYELLQPLCNEVYFSLSADSNNFLPDHCLVVRDNFVPAIGPMGGVLSTLKLLKRPLLVLAIDLPHFDTEALQMLILERDKEQHATAFVNQSGQIEPLSAIFEPSIVDHLSSCRRNGTLCLRKILTLTRVKKVIPKNYRWITNINTLSEFKNTQTSGKKVTVRYFASLKENTGRPQETRVTNARTVWQLYEEVMSSYGHPHVHGQEIRFAKNGAMVSYQELISDGDDLVFIPAVNGG